MDYNILYDWYKTFSCHKTIRKINTFVSHNKEKANVEELKIINENKYVSHSIAILTAIASCSFLYMHALYLSRHTISKLIQLNLKESSNEGIGNYVGEMYKKDEPKDYLNLVRKAL